VALKGTLLTGSFISVSVNGNKTIELPSSHGNRAFWPSNFPSKLIRAWDFSLASAIYLLSIGF
jgi:hypothetical protein